MLAVQNNLANTYLKLGRLESALQMKRDVYSGQLKLHGEEHLHTIFSANNYADCLVIVGRFEEARYFLRKVLPLARRVFGESHEITLRMRSVYAQALYRDPGTTFDGLCEAVTTLEETERIARRVLGGAHPITGKLEGRLYVARQTLAAFDAP